MTDREAKQNLILEAAKRLFEEKGYTKTSIKDIARACDMGVGTIYLYFKNREALALATLKLGAFQDLYEALKYVTTPIPLNDIEGAR